MLGYATGQPKAFAAAVDIPVISDSDRATINSSNLKSDPTSSFNSNSSSVLTSIIYHRQNFDDSPLKIPPSQPPSKSSPQVHITTTSNVSSLHLSARELQNQNFFEEVKDSEEDGDGDDDDGDFQAEVEIMIAGTYFYYFCSYDLDMIYFILFFIYLL